MRNVGRGSTTHRILVALIISVLALPLAAPVASAAKTKLMSQSSAGDQSALDCNWPDISGDGNVVVFVADGDDLLAADHNGRRDVYRRIVSKGKTKLVSRAYGGGLANGESSSPSISANGRYVAFTSDASNLISRPVHGSWQVYRRDLQTGKTVLVSKGPDGVADASSIRPHISANGRYVVFDSAAENLSGLRTDGWRQVYLRDLVKKKTYLISQAKGYGGRATSMNAVVSADGRFVAFESDATNLSTKDERHRRQIFLRDRKLKKTYLISKNAKGKAGDGESEDVAMSADGRVIVFESHARNLITWGVDSNDHKDIYKYDRSKKKMRRASLDWKGRQLEYGSLNPDISADGRFISFMTGSRHVIKSGSNGFWQVYRRGPAASSVRLISRNSHGEQALATPYVPRISADGRFVTWYTGARNLTKGTDDNGNTQDVFRAGQF